MDEKKAYDVKNNGSQYVKAPKTPVNTNKGYVVKTGTDLRSKSK